MLWNIFPSQFSFDTVSRQTNIQKAVSVSHSLWNPRFRLVPHLSPRILHYDLTAAIQEWCRITEEFRKPAPSHLSWPPHFAFEVGVVSGGTDSFRGRIYEMLKTALVRNLIRCDLSSQLKTVRYPLGVRINIWIRSGTRDSDRTDCRDWGKLRLKFWWNSAGGWN